jgi:hypothetical protein
MEKPVKKEQQIDKLQKASYIILKKEDDYYMSKYKTGEITLEGVTKAAKMLKDAFPQLEKGFYDILLDRVREYEFTDNKLIDAVKYVIDTCKYPQPTISSIISYDRQIRLYTHDQMIEMMKYDDNIFNKCKIFKPNENKIFYYKK